MSRALGLAQAPLIAGSRRFHVAGALLWALIALGPLAMLVSELLAAPTEIAPMAVQLISPRWLGLLAKSIALACPLGQILKWLCPGAVGLSAAAAVSGAALPARHRMDQRWLCR
jgi:hypothetical protein